MSKYHFGSIVDRYFRNTLQRLADDAAAQGKAIQDLVAEGQLTDEQYAQLITTINGLISKGNVSVDDIDINRGKLLPRHMSEEVLKMITGDAPVNAVPSNNSITRNKYFDRSVSDEKTDFIRVGKNLSNPDNWKMGKTFSSDGTVVDSPYYLITGYDRVFGGEQYTFNKPRTVFFYNEDLEIVESVQNENHEVLTHTAPETGYVRASVLSPGSSTDNSKYFQIENSPEYTGYEPYQREISNLITDGININNKSINIDKLDFLYNSKNMYDESVATDDYFVTHTRGVLNAYDGYKTSPFIKVGEGKTYTISTARKFAFYDDTQTFENGADLDHNPYTFTAEKDGYIRFSYHLSNTPDPVQMEEGGSVTYYEPYGVKFPLLALTDEQKGVKNSEDNGGHTTQKEGAMTVIKNGENFTIVSDFGEDEIKIRVGSDSTERNGVFNFSSTRLNDEVIHSNSDDVTPVRFFNTVGGNHGYTIVRRISYSHDKTSADLGSRWTDGTDEYAILDVDSGSLVIGKKYKEVDGEFIGQNASPAINLSHVSGATNTSDINVSNQSSMQLYPSINRHTLEYFLDDKKIENDGNYQGDELQVRERYNIMSYKGIYDWATNNVGQSFKNDEVPGCIEVTTTYIFREGGKCLVSYAINPLEKITFKQSGFLQAAPLEETTYTLHRYMPNVLSNDGYDFTQIIDMSNYSANLLYRTEDLKDPSIPPHRYTDILKSGGGVVSGFSLGYVIDKTNAKNSDRINNASLFWDMRGTKKVYPAAIEGITLNPGEYMSFQGYRNYLSKKELGDATNVNVVKDKSATYVYIDYHKNVTAQRIPMPDEIGKTIEIVESENFTLLNDVVDSGGVVFNISNGYGYGILKLI